MNSFTRNGQTITFTTDDVDADLSQTSRYNNRAGMEIKVKDYLIDGVHVIASTLGVARQMVRESKNATAETVDQRINRYSLEGAELAAIALSDRPDDEAAIDNATDAGATWGKTSGMYYLAMPNSTDMIAIIERDGDISFGSSIDQYRN